MKRSLALAAVLLVAVLLAACSGKSDTGVKVNGPAAAPPPKLGTNGEPDDPSTLSTDSGGAVYEWAAAPNLASFVSNSHAAVVGRVVNIGPARWNTKDGAPGDERALQFRDATLVVDEVVYDSATLKVAVGKELQVRLTGDGTDTGTAVAGAAPVRRVNALSGPVAVGDKVLWVLGMAQFPFNDGMTTVRTEAIPKLVTDFYGAWKVDSAADRALSILSARTVPFRALVLKLKVERATPSPTGVGSRGRVNPLE
jgi:hypothetical protein